jgi:hypothetical protein
VSLPEEAENVPVAGAESIKLRKEAYMLRYLHIGKFFGIKSGGEELPVPEKFSDTFYTVHDFLLSLQCGRAAVPASSSRVEGGHGGPPHLEASNSDRRLLPLLI